MHRRIAHVITSLTARRPYVVLAVACVLTVVLGYFASKLQLKSSFVELLPPDFKSVQDLKRYEDEFGSAANLIVLVEHENRDRAVAFVRDFATAVSELPDVLYVDYEKPVGFFENNALLYVDMKDLEEIDRRIVDYVEKERAGAAPLWQSFMNFTDEEDALDFSDIEQKYQVGGRYERFLSGRYYEDAEEALIAFLIRPREDSLDLNRSKELVGKVKAIEERLDPRSYDDSLVVGYTGQHQKVIDHHNHLKSEIVKIMAIVLTALILLLFFYYRRLSAIVLIGLPLGMSVVWTAGIVAVALGHINLITSFSGGVLLGLGSDYGIYLLSRYLRERRCGKDLVQSLDMTYAKTGRATAGACLTSMVAFGIMMFSGFTAFAEFGFIGVTGILTAYIAMAAVLPALITICDRTRVFEWEERWFKSHRWSIKPSLKFSVSVIAVTVFIAVIAVTLLSTKHDFRIDFDCDKIDDYSYAVASLDLSNKADKIFSNTLRPTVVIADDEAEEREVVSALEERSRQNPGVFELILSESMFVPDGQDEKLAKISELREHARLISSKTVSEKYRARLDSVGKIDGVAGLPREVRRMFESPDERSPSSLVYITSAVDRRVVENVQLFGGAVRDVTLDSGKKVSATGTWMILYDVMQILNRLAPRIFVVSMLAMFVIVAIDLRRIRSSLLICASQLVGIMLFFAFLALTRVKFNIFNVAVVPVIIGIGIDSYIHFYYKYRELGNDVYAAWKAMFSPILIANLTTMIGFGGFALSANAGLRSIGVLALEGVLAIILTSLLWFPAMLHVLASLKLAYHAKATTDFEYR